MGLFNLFKPKTVTTVTRVMVLLSPPKPDVVIEVAKAQMRNILEYGDIRGAVDGLDIMIQNLLALSYSWTGMSNTGEVFDYAEDAGSYFDELIQDNSSRYLSSDLQVLERSTTGYTTQNVVVMLTVAFYGTHEGVEQSVYDAHSLEEVLLTLRELAAGGYIASAAIDVSPSSANEELTEDHLIQNFSELNRI